MTTIPIKGTIVSNDYKEVYDWFGYDNISPKDVSDILKGVNGQDVTLEINSPGGYISAGSEIYTVLREYREYTGNITAKIVGQACSAASWIALAADKVIMSPTAQMMIHRASTDVSGNIDDLSSAANAVNEMDKAYVDLYSKKTGKTPDEIYQMMAKTTWMNAKTAVENGFADEIMFENEPAVVNADGDLVVKPEMISKIKNLLHQERNEEKPQKSQEKENLALLLWE